MKRSVILSVLAAVAIFAVCANAEAGMFGRLHTVKGCNPCEPAACEPCEPVACEPCVPIACEPCEPACYDPCGPRGPFRPFGGFFAGLKGKLAVKNCSPCEPVGCDPCEPVCNPCEASCDEPACNPCGAPFRPFKGAWARWKAKFSGGCNVGCDPCEPVCDPCGACM